MTVPQTVSQDADTFPGTFPEMLAAAPREGTALIFEGRRWSYSELDELIRRTAGGLRAAGIGPGDRIGLWLPNCPAYVALLFACAQIGAVAVAVNTRFRRVEVEDIVSRGGCRALAVWPGFRGIDFAGILAEMDPGKLAGVDTLILCGDDGAAPAALPGAHRMTFDDLAAAAPTDECHASPDAAVCLFTTSGTTSKPKFVVHRQAAPARHAAEVARAFGFTAPDAVVYQSVPLCGVFGFCAFMATMAAGRPSVMVAAFDADEAVELILHHAVTDTVGADDMVDRLLTAAGPRRLPSLRQIVYARFNAALADIVERADAHGIKMTGVYGSSELQALFSRHPLDAPVERRKRGGGLPVSPDTRVRARSRETGAILPHGEPGELEILTPSRMVGYDANPQATAEGFTEDGYFRTGDMGYTTADEGFVYLARYGDALRLGGFLTHPAEIEEHLLTHPAVEGAQVVGVATEAGDVPVAFVTLRPGAPVPDETALRDHCKGALAAYKVPRRLIAIEDFPVTTGANGVKIQRNRLRDMAAGHLREG